MLRGEGRDLIYQISTSKIRHSDGVLSERKVTELRRPGGRDLPSSTGNRCHLFHSRDVSAPICAGCVNCRLVVRSGGGWWEVDDGAMFVDVHTISPRILGGVECAICGSDQHCGSQFGIEGFGCSNAEACGY